MPENPSLSPAWLLTGMGGVLGWGASEALPQDAPVVIAARQRSPLWQDHVGVHLDLATTGSIQRLVEEIRPEVVVHAACLSRAADCAADPERTERINVQAVAELMTAAERVGTFVVYVSTEQVFSGTAARYFEDDRPDSQDVYGASKARAEALVLAAGGAVARLPLLLGAQVDNPHGPVRCGADTAVRRAVQRGERPKLFTDEWRCPVAADAAAQGLWRLAASRRAGVVHLAGNQAVSRYELGVMALEATGLEGTEIEPSSIQDFTGPPRQARLELDCRRAQEVLAWEPGDLRQSLARLSGLPRVP